MKVLDRYLIDQFLRPLAACTAIITLLVFVGHYFDKMSIFNQFHARTGDIIAYIVLGIPFWLNIVFPVSTLLALMFSLSSLQQHGEITAMQSAGISTIRIYAPFIAMGLAISFASLAGGTTFFPAIDAKANLLYRKKIKHEQIFPTLKNNIIVLGRDYQRFTIGSLDLRAGKMTNVVIDQFDPHTQLRKTLSAQLGQFKDGQWLFDRGKIIYFHAGGDVQEEPFQERLLDIHEKPEDFVYENRKPDDMTYTELRTRIRHLRDLGLPSDKERVALQLQFALPFANVLVILFGIPFARKNSRKGNTQAVAYAFGVTFLYWGTASFFQSFGEHGQAPAWLAAWAANILFGLGALYMLQRS